MRLKKKIKLINNVIKFLENVSEEKATLVKIEKRYKEVEEVIYELAKVFYKEQLEVKITIGVDELTRTALFAEIEAPLLVVCKEVKIFCHFLSKSDAVDVVAKNNGNVCLILSFEDCFQWEPKKKEAPFPEFNE